VAQFLTLISTGLSMVRDTVLSTSMSKSGPTHHKEIKERQLSWVKPEHHYQALVFGKFSPLPTVCVAFDDTGSSLQKVFCSRHFRSLSYKSRHYNQLEVCSDLFHGRAEQISHKVLELLKEQKRSLPPWACDYFSLFRWDSCFLTWSSES